MRLPSGHDVHRADHAYSRNVSTVQDADHEMGYDLSQLCVKVKVN